MTRPASGDLQKQCCFISVFCNGHLVGQHEPGYIGFKVRFDQVANFGGTNVIAVRVDARAKEGWFYEGCGIYRHVWLTANSPLHLQDDGLYADARYEPQGDAREGRVSISAEIVCETDLIDRPNAVLVRHEVFDPRGRRIAESEYSESLNGSRQRCSATELSINTPQLWSLDSPQRYQLRTQLLDESGQTLDEKAVSFGFRHVAFDAEQGFRLNGQPLKLKGVCCHQDHAGLGSAVPDGLLAWRLKRLKAIGVNAYRCAHNPPAPELLELCDRIGLLVIDETRCFGTAPTHLDAVERMVRRDRNHPCVILWSLANEEMQVQVTDVGQRMFRTLKQVVLDHDTSRGITAAVNVGWDRGEGFIREVDVHGINYLNQGDLDALRRVAPEMPVILSEGASAVSTRGVYTDDPDRGWVTCFDTHEDPGPHESVTLWPYWGRAAEASWKVVAERDDLAGTFVWTGFDYRGEQSPYVCWPNVMSHFGIFDACGFPKDAAWCYRAWWTDQPVLHVLPHWNREGIPGDKRTVWVYSNAERVSIAINDRKLETKMVPPNGHVVWEVNYEPGELVATGFWRDGSSRKALVETTGPSHTVRLRAELADGCDPHTVLVEVAVCDPSGRVVPTAKYNLHFAIDGEACLLGLGNGDPASVELDRGNAKHGQRTAFHGYAQAILRVSGPSVLKVHSDGLISSSIDLDGLTPDESGMGCLAPDMITSRLPVGV